MRSGLSKKAMSFGPVVSSSTFDTEMNKHFIFLEISRLSAQMNCRRLVMYHRILRVANLRLNICRVWVWPCPQNSSCGCKYGLPGPYIG